MTGILFIGNYIIEDWRKEFKSRTGIEFLVSQFFCPKIWKIKFCTVILWCICFTVLLFSWMFFDTNEHNEINEYVNTFKGFFIRA